MCYMTKKGPSKTNVAKLATEIEPRGVEEETTIAIHIKRERDGLRKKLKERESGLRGRSDIVLKPQMVNRMPGESKLPLLIARDEKIWA